MLLETWYADSCAIYSDFYCYLINKFDNSSGKGVFAWYKMCSFNKRNCNLFRSKILK